MNSDLYKPYDIRKIPTKTTQTIPFRMCEVVERKNRHHIVMEDIEYLRTSFEKIRIDCIPCMKIKT